MTSFPRSVRDNAQFESNPPRYHLQSLANPNGSSAEGCRECGNGTTSAQALRIRDGITGEDRVCCARHFRQAISRDMELLDALLRFLEERQQGGL